MSTSGSIGTIAISQQTDAAALVFLHGLGDTPKGWSSLESQLPSIRPNLSKLVYSFPHAPTIPISINHGMEMPGWFDIYTWPIGVGSRDDVQGTKDAVSEVEKHVLDLVNRGIPKERIVIGGFSQGGAIALLAAYNDVVKRNTESTYAACICLSGWLTRLDDFSRGLSESSKEIPLFWGHGEWDDKVLFEQQKFGIKTLKQLGLRSIANKQYSTGHSSTYQELEDLAAFLDYTLFGDGLVKQS